MGFRGNEANTEIYKRVREHFPVDRRTAVDVGAYHGEWANLLAKDFDTVIAFEVRPESFDVMAEGAPDNVIPLNIGLGSEFRTVRFALRHGRYAQAESARHEPDIERVDYDVRPLDEFVVKQVDFIKIDVDGMEAAVLEGARETIGKWRPVIVIETKLMKPATKTYCLDLIGYKVKAEVSAIDEVWAPQ